MILKRLCSLARCLSDCMLRAITRQSLFVTAVIGLCIGWAAAPILPVAGVPNFHRVNDAVYRGGQPTVQGLHNLAKLGIKTVLDLRLSRRVADWEEKEVMSVGLRYIHLPLYGKETPTQSDINR